MGIQRVVLRVVGNQGLELGLLLLQIAWNVVVDVGEEIADRRLLLGLGTLELCQDVGADGRSELAVRRLRPYAFAEEKVPEAKNRVVLPYPLLDLLATNNKPAAWCLREATSLGRYASESSEVLWCPTLRSAMQQLVGRLATVHCLPTCTTAPR